MIILEEEERNSYPLHPVIQIKGKQELTYLIQPQQLYMLQKRLQIKTRKYNKNTNLIYSNKPTMTLTHALILAMQARPKQFP